MSYGVTYAGMWLRFVGSSAPELRAKCFHCRALPQAVRVGTFGATLMSVFMAAPSRYCLPYEYGTFGYP